MKKFKGGLYADLGNYKTSLPNTEILNNFFASNPVGYRSGGMVKGISGGNPTGMQVTGGFLNRAQKMQSGGQPFAFPELSAYYQGDKKMGGKQLRELNIPTPMDILSNRYNDYNSIMKEIARLQSLRSEDMNFGGIDAISQPKKQFEKQKSEALEMLAKKAEGIGIIGDTEERGMEPDRADVIEKIKEAKSAYKNKEDKKETEEKKEIEDKEPELSSTEKAEKSLEESEIGKVDNTTTSLVENVDKTPLAESDEMINNLNSKVDQEVKDAIDGIKSISFEDNEALNNIGKELYGKDKEKDAPAWAMPLMMAGLQMAASDNPSMLGAMGEGGIKGLEEYARMQKEKKQDAKDKIELDLKKYNSKTERTKMEFDKETTIANINVRLSEISNQNEQFRIQSKMNNEQFYLNYAKDKEQFNKEYNLKIAGFEYDKLSDTRKHFLNEEIATNQAELWNSQAKAYDKPEGKVHTVEIGGEKRFVWYGYDPTTEDFIMKPMETVDGIHLGPSDDDDLLNSFIKYTADSVISGTYTQDDINDAWEVFKGLNTDVGTLNKPKDK